MNQSDHIEGFAKVLSPSPPPKNKIEQTNFSQISPSLENWRGCQNEINLTRGQCLKAVQSQVRRFLIF